MVARPVAGLAEAILKSAGRCAELSRHLLAFPTEAEKAHQQVSVCFEYACCFAHMAMRVAFERLGPEQRDKLQVELRPLIVEPVARCWQGSEEVMREWAVRFYQYMDDSQKEYARCTGFLPHPSEQAEFTGSSLLAALARNVMELSGYEVPQWAKAGFPTDWAYADYHAAGAIGCRYSASPKVANPVGVLEIIHLAGKEIRNLDLERHVDSVGKSYSETWPSL